MSSSPNSKPTTEAQKLLPNPKQEVLLNSVRLTLQERESLKADLVNSYNETKESMREEMKAKGWI